MSRKIYLIRHGLPDFGNENNQPYYLGGGTDIDLREDQKEKAARLKEYFADKGIENWYSSPMKRAVQTLEAFLPEGTDYTVIEEAREISYGEWEGKPKAEYFPFYQKSFLTENAPAEAFPKGGESQDHAARRFLRAVQKSEGSCVLVAHGAVINLLVCLLEGTPYHRFLDGKNPYLGITCLTESDKGSYTVDFREFVYGDEVIPDSTYYYRKEMNDGRN
ncbi:MAG: histidine phosphatase family protein [Erysipelotrichaceae bacterium]|nr:histidine phosphatase family protein [Erysipelotrichaceae bacterium]